MITWNSLPQNSPAEHLAGFPRTCTVLQHTAVEEATSMHVCLQEWVVKVNRAAYNVTKSLKYKGNTVPFLPRSQGQQGETHTRCVRMSMHTGGD